MTIKHERCRARIRLSFRTVHVPIVIIAPDWPANCSSRLFPFAEILSNLDQKVEMANRDLLTKKIAHT